MTALPSRIESKFIPEPNSGCWLWLGGTNQKNYGHIWSSELKRHERAHRMVYQILVGGFLSLLASNWSCIHATVRIA